MTNVQNDLRTRRMASWSQPQEVEMVDEEAHRKEEDEKLQVETLNQAQMFGVADAKTRRKKEDKKSQVETWSQTHAVGVEDEGGRKCVGGVSGSDEKGQCERDG